MLPRERRWQAAGATANLTRQFLNGGPRLKFMSGGGGGQEPGGGSTARVLVVTETDGMDRPGLASRESDQDHAGSKHAPAPFGQPQAHLPGMHRQHGKRAGTWQEYVAGGRESKNRFCPARSAMLGVNARARSIWWDGKGGGEPSRRPEIAGGLRLSGLWSCLVAGPKPEQVEAKPSGQVAARLGQEKSRAVVAGGAGVTLTK